MKNRIHRFLICSLLILAATAFLRAQTQVAVPVLNPSGGFGYAPYPVMMTTVTPGATIRYTINGTTPTETNGIIYNGSPVILSQSVIVEAIAYENGYADSGVAVGNYHVSQPMAGDPPYFDPPAGNYTSAQTVAIFDGLSPYGAKINYTTDGTTPTETHGQPYLGPLAVGGTTTINAMAYGVYGFADSIVASATYTISTPIPTLPRIYGSNGKRR
ncbi:MAG: chitobiase/beta-hexosaminidase C-terminal domain-containing protein [Opitutaceae bacterium]